MTLIVTANIAGQTRGEPVRLPDRRRRRLSTIVARHKPPAGRKFIVSVHRRGETFLRPTDQNRRLRASWSRTLVGPDDVVLFTTVPLGRGVASIGLAIASIALIAIAPYAAPALATALGGISATAVQAGLVIGGVALGYAAQASAAAKKKTERSLFSVTGGGNVPKPGARKPLLYGRCWSTPPLSQKDFITYDGDTMVLTKRMTLGIGRFQIHAVHVGEAVFWLEGGGIQAPFTSTDGTFGTQIEFLYGQPSAIAPGDVISSPSVGGQEMPRPGGNPEWTPWFRLTPQGVTADAAQMSWTYPAIYRVSSQGRQAPTVAGVIFQAREINPNTGEVIGPEFVLHNSSEGATALTTTPLRRSAYVRLPKNGAFQVRAQNAWPEAVGFEQKNAASWDEMAAIKDDVRIRPNTTEIVMRVRAGKGLTVTAFSEIWVDATRIVPVWNGSAWVEQAERKAVWAFADLVRSQHGLALPNGFDADKAIYYHHLLEANDTFDGALPEVSSFWEAASEVLLPLRCDPVKVGPVHSFVRDESRAEPRHVLTRRQIVRDSAGATFKTKVEGGDVIVEFDRDGDPRRPDEVRFHYGPATRTPKRYRVNGVRDGLHALKHATWLAAVAVFRGAERRITTEWDGRLVFPGDHVLSDLWFLKGKQSFGVASASGNMLTLDVTANVPAAWGYGSIRTREGREWGILRMRGVGPRGLELHPDDVTALAAQTGLALADVLNRDSQGPTTIVIGDLVELQETYVARSAIPSDADHVQIEMVADDARVWQLLDEQVIAPAPVNADNLAEPLVPQISVLHARCERIETGIEVVWGVSVTRGARNYEADISYDAGGSWEPLSPYGPASSGRAQMRQSDQPVTVRARAFGRTGLPGDYVSTTFTTVAPIVDGGLVDITNLQPIPYEKLGEDVQERFEAVQAAADAASAEAQEALAGAVGRVDDLRRALALSPDVRQGYVDSLMGDVQGSLSMLGNVATRLLGEVAVLRDRMAAAGIEVLPDQGIVRIAALTRLETEVGQRLTSLSFTVDALRGELELYGSVQEGDLSGFVTSLNTVQQRLSAAEARISLLATAAQFDEASARLGTVEATLDAVNAEIELKAAQAVVDAQALTLQQVGLRLSAAEGRIVTFVQAAGASTTDNAKVPRLLSQLSDLLQNQIGALYDQFARAETNTSANFDAAGRSVAEVSTRLLAFQGDASAQFVSVTRAIAGNGEALVQTQILLQAQIGQTLAALSREEQARVTADGAVTVRLDGALSRIGTTEARITTEEQTRASETGALSSRLVSLDARTGANEAGITSLGKAVTDNQSATASQFQGVNARFGTVDANISTLTKAYADGNAALAQRIDSLVVQTNSDRAYFLAEQQARIDTDGVHSTQIQGLVAQTNSDRAYFLSEQTARIQNDSALASQIQEVFARTDAGTAAGRIKFEAVSAPGGVAARFSIQLSTERGGFYRNSGLFMDILGDGSSRVIIDANIFALTANGGVTYPFTFDGQTLTVPSLRVTQQAILPGAVSDRLSLVAQEVDGGGFSNDWREVPGTGITLYPDTDWALLFSGTAILQAVAQGNGNLSTNTRLLVAVGLDGAPYGASFAVASATGGGGGPPVHTVDTPIASGPALFEILPAGTPRRVALLYQLTGQIGSGRIKYGQIKAHVTKR
ncbi:host specificity factor TipJ family phage tail protein [Methylorubrum extorquens]|uniref:host specificity factor TipJ family phage tail protein n=1 Tax=Methylorubrum extorquens TaxID=408 RepID=UPI0022383957|nr:host specificity factor TipJ family phage tail protein [Methylorubrum extorquens]UYW33614.1 host specificity factor TipJ family phage tail protein [Methylorubrum extorquens]